jgi:putative flippase GtrA
LQGGVVFALAWGITAGSLVALHAAAAHPSPAEEILVLTAANLFATVLRFVLLRGWVFRTRRASPDRGHRSTAFLAAASGASADHPDTMETVQ